MFGERKRETHTHRGREQVREWVEEEKKKKRDLISYASADHTACGTVKSPEQNTTLNNELYVHNNIFPFHFDIHMKMASGLKNKENKSTPINNKQERTLNINSLTSHGMEPTRVQCLIFWHDIWHISLI